MPTRFGVWKNGSSLFGVGEVKAAGRAVDLMEASFSGF
jgi:hypothetical protein